MMIAPNSLFQKETDKKCLRDHKHVFQQTVVLIVFPLASDLVLQAAVLSLCVLPDDHDVNVLVASLDPGEGLTVHHIGVQVQARADSTHKRPNYVRNESYFTQKMTLI